MAYGDGGPPSPGGQQGGSKKEINAKMIYGKAQPQDTRCVVCMAPWMACVGSSVLYEQLLIKLQDETKLCQNKVSYHWKSYMQNINGSSHGIIPVFAWVS